MKENEREGEVFLKGEAAHCRSVLRAAKFLSYVLYPSMSADNREGGIEREELGKHPAYFRLTLPVQLTVSRTM